MAPKDSLDQGPTKTKLGRRKTWNVCFKYVFPGRACKSNKVLVLARQLQEISRVYSNIQYTASNTHRMGTKNALANTQKWCWQVCYISHENAYDVLTSISVVRGLLSQLRSLASKVRSEILWIVTTEASHHQERQLQGWQLHHPVMFFLDRPPPLAMLPRPCSGASEGSAVCQIFLSWPIKQFQFKISTLPLTQTRGFWWASGAPWFLTRTLPNFYCARLPRFAQVSCASG